MGNICLKSNKRAVNNSASQTPSETILPPPSLWRHNNPKELVMRPRETLQDLCIAAVVAAWDALPASAVEALPSDLLQRVFDELVATDRLKLADLSRFNVLDLDSVVLVGRADVKNDWLKALDRCSRLRSLDLSGCCQIGDMGVAALKRHRCLVRLRLGSCLGVTDFALQYLKGLTRLQELSLSGCEGLSGEGLGALGALTQLSRLDLGQCRGLKAGLQSLSSLRCLAVLQLGWCVRLGDSEVTSLQGLVGLRELGLAGTQVGDDGLADLSSLSLTHLDLSSCAKVTEAAGPWLARMTRLKVLSLERCDKVGNAVVSALCGAQLPSLSRLVLSFTAVSTTGLTGLTALTSLTALLLDSCEVGDGVGRVLRRLPRLAYLDLAETAVGDAVLEALTAPLPSATTTTTAAATAAPFGNPGVHVTAPPVYGAAAANLHGGGGGSLGGSRRAVGPAGRGTLGRGAIGAAAGCSSTVDVTTAADPSMMTLTHLDLTSTRVTDEGLAPLSRLQGLRYLSLDSGNLSDAALRHVTALSALTALDVWSCRLGESGAAMLGAAAALRGLRELQACGGGITDAAAAHLARLTALTCLNLSLNPRLGDTGVAALAGQLTELQRLSLNKIAVTAACLPHLGRLPWLHYLSLCDTTIPEAALETLRSARNPSNNSNASTNYSAPTSPTAPTTTANGITGVAAAAGASLWGGNGSTNGTSYPPAQAAPDWSQLPIPPATPPHAHPPLTIKHSPLQQPQQFRAHAGGGGGGAGGGGVLAVGAHAIHFLPLPHPMPA